MSLFERTKKLAELRGYTLAELMRKAEVGEKSPYTWRPSKTYPNGITPRHETLEKIAKAGNSTVDYLLGNTDNPDPTTTDNTTTKPQDLADKDIVLSFEGKQIPPEDLETIRRFLRGGKDDK
jgi:transcriptional regulator with XRE-family HTH domain